MAKTVFHAPQEILKLFKDNGLPENFCIVPFTNLIFNPGGKVSVCRHKGTDHSIGHLSENTFSEIWNNDYIRAWREEFLSGNVKICSQEQKRDVCHLNSSEYHFFQDTKFEVRQDPKLMKFTANFNGQCNLQCTMCHVWTMENGFYDKNNFWENAEQNLFPYIKEIEFLSGEPFIQKDTYKLIDRISAINKDCQWSVTTNGQWSLNSVVMQKLDKIEIKNIIVSIDSLNPDRFAKLRGGGSLSRTLKTIDDLISYEKVRVASGRSPLGLTAHFTAVSENFLEALDMVTFCDQKGLRHGFRTLVFPEALSVLSLPYPDRLRLIESFVEAGSANQIKKAMRVILPLVDELNKSDKIYIFQKISDKFKENDRSV
jgi:radical SAM protein with 4Fe4S-binding SPASM domain